MSINTSTSSYKADFQHYLADRSQHDKRTETSRILGIFKRKKKIPQTAMTLSTVTTFLQSTFNEIKREHAKEELFRKSTSDRKIDNPHAKLNGILLTARLKAAIARNPEIYLDPKPVQVSHMQSMATPLLIDMMSNDTEGTLNQEMKGSDERFGTAHLAKFLANLSIACGGAGLEQVLKTPGAADRLQQTDPDALVPRATLVTALGFKYHTETGQLLISRNLFNEEARITQEIEKKDELIGNLLNQDIDQNSDQIVTIKNDIEELRTQLDTIKPDLIRLKELSLHLRITHVKNALDELNLSSKGVMERVKAFIPGYQTPTEKLKADLNRLLKQQASVQVEKQEQMCISIDQQRQNSELTSTERQKITAQLQIVATAHRKAQSNTSTHNTYVRTQLQWAKDKLSILDNAHAQIDSHFETQLLTLIELAILPRSDSALQKEVKQWLSKNQAKILDATSKQANKDKLTKAFQRLLTPTFDSISIRAIKVAGFATACVLANRSLVRGASAWKVGLKVAALLGVSVGVTDQKLTVRLYNRAVVTGKQLAQAVYAKAKAQQIPVKHVTE